MPNHLPVPYLGQLIAFLLTVVVVVPLFKRLKISPILGYLAVGAAIGPFALAWVPDVDAVRTLAEFGVVFLLFSIGLELSFARLRSYARLIFGFGSAQLIITALIVAGIALLWGNTPANAIIIGLCMAISSTAMVVPLLQERGEFATIPGRASFSVLLLQDLAVVPMLILLSVLGGQSDMSLGQSLGLALVKGILALVVIGVVGRFALRYLFQKAMASHSVDVFMAVMLLAILATSMITELAGLSLSLGAFLAGLLLAETEYRHQIESEIEPFKGLLLGLFFMGVGMNLDVALAFAHGLWVLASVVGLVAIKALVASLLARCFGLNWVCAVRTGFLLAQAGEFAFVIIGQATLSYGLIDQALGQFMVVVAGLSMAATPLVPPPGQRFAQQLAARAP
ncbi:MAG TPA: cation:proton antiporter, partial [Cellvibrionaceae bacterium]|nr:cation:proton antiporter [Cellvibrionaceae bacterium]